MIYTLLKDQAADIDTPSLSIDTHRVKGTVQVENTTDVLLIIQGRLSLDASWSTVSSFDPNSNGLEPIDLYPYMRATLSGVGTGTASAWLCDNK